MLATRWEPVFGMSRLQRDMDRLLDDIVQHSPRYARKAYPPLNLSEDAEHYYVEAELPGLDLDDLELQVNGGNQLSIKGARKQPEPDATRWHRHERAYGEFKRTVELPANVDSEKVSATFTDGVLAISLAKREEAKPRKITVNVE